MVLAPSQIFYGAYFHCIGVTLWYHLTMKAKHRKALQLIFKRPVSGNVKWSDTIAMLNSIGAELEEREGSLVAIHLSNDIQIQHRPHPSPCMDKGAVAALRKFLETNGVKP
jgi:hypothetical protein